MRIYAQKQSQPQQEASPHPSRLTQHTIVNEAVRALPHVSAEGREVVPGTPATTRFAHDFSRIPLHSKAPVRLQTRLKVNTPGDIYEQEADRLSEQVMSIAEPRLQRTCACGGGCPTCRNEQAAHERLQTHRVEANDSRGLAAPTIVNEVLHSSGQPLDPSTRAFMESRFGHDFSHVRVHTDARAAESARALNALAYTVGRDIVFDPGPYRPASTEGRKLLAHELAHVLQQGTGGRLEQGVFNAGDHSEQAAAHTLPDWIARRVTPRPSHVIARMSSGDETPTAVSETHDSEAGNEATLSDASAVGSLQAKLVHFYNKKNEFTKTLPAGCENKPSETGVGADGFAANGMVMAFVVESIKQGKTSLESSVPPPDIKFETSQNRTSYSWQRIPVNGVQIWVELGPPRVNWTDLNYHQHCWIPDKDNEIFHWDRPGWLGTDPRGEDYDDYTVSTEATGFVLKTNFETFVLAGPEGKDKTRIPKTYYWHSINCMGPVGEDGAWKMTDNPTKNEIELEKAAMTKPVDVK